VDKQDTSSETSLDVRITALQCTPEMVSPIAEPETTRDQTPQPEEDLFGRDDCSSASNLVKREENRQGKCQRMTINPIALSLLVESSASHFSLTGPPYVVSEALDNGQYHLKLLCPEEIKFRLSKSP
jgi:hypothetical protein